MKHKDNDMFFIKFHVFMVKKISLEQSCTLYSARKRLSTIWHFLALTQPSFLILYFHNCEWSYR